MMGSIGVFVGGIGFLLAMLIALLSSFKYLTVRWISSGIRCTNDHLRSPNVTLGYQLQKLLPVCRSQYAAALLIPCDHDGQSDMMLCKAHVSCNSSTKSDGELHTCLRLLLGDQNSCFMPLLL